jgi:hypothetical protein
VLFEFLGGLLNGLPFVGRLYLANPYLLGGKFVDRPSKRLRGFRGLPRHVSVFFGRKLGQQVRPVASDDATYFVVHSADVVEAARKPLGTWAPFGIRRRERDLVAPVPVSKGLFLTSTLPCDPFRLRADSRVGVPNSRCFLNRILSA